MCKELRLPLSDPFIQQLDPFDLEFIEWSLVCDDPKLLEQVQNHYYDPEFEEWVNEFDKEQEQLKKQQATAPSIEMPDTETVEWSNRKPPTRQTILPMEEYEVGDTSQFSEKDWEREE